MIVDFEIYVGLQHKFFCIFSLIACVKHRMRRWLADIMSDGVKIASCSLNPRTTKLLWGILVSIRPSVRPSVRLSRLPCPLCIIYSSGWILSILATNDHYHERVCRTQWPLTLTFIFKVIRPWLRKSCPLCSVYSSGWILFIFGTNDHYH